MVAADDGAVDVSVLGQRMRVPAAAGQRAGETATLVVRPESIRLGGGDLRATVRRSSFLGPLVEYELLMGDAIVLAVDPDWMGHGLHAVGDEVACSIRPEQAYALPPGQPAEVAPEDPDAVAPEA